MSTVVLKFGGSSVADNIKLNVVAEKIIEFKEKGNRVVAVVSAQGKTTDNLIKEAQELSAVPEERELDMLLSTGEQVTASKLSILLNRKGHKTISLTGWQAGIQTSKVYGSASIEAIDPSRIKSELDDGKIVIVAGFQGLNEDYNITTLGRGGSDTTAVAIEAAIEAGKCYIFSDVDGIYSADPNMIEVTKKLDEISFEEMSEIADAGAKVLHNRCIQIGQKFDCDIIAASTFSSAEGTKVQKKIEGAEVKSIVKNEKLILIRMNDEKEDKVDNNTIYAVYSKLLEANIIVENFRANGSLKFRIKESDLNKVRDILEKNFDNYKITQEKIAKITIVGYGITKDNVILKKVMDILEDNSITLYDINLTQAKIEILTNEMDNDVIEELHRTLIMEVK